MSSTPIAILPSGPIFSQGRAGGGGLDDAAHKARGKPHCGARLTSAQRIEAGRGARSAPRQRGLTGRLGPLIQARAQTEWAGAGVGEGRGRLR